MAVEGILRRTHRVIAVLFLLSVPPAAIASSTAGDPSPVVYLPLFPLLGLSLTGSYLLGRPWIKRLRSS